MSEILMISKPLVPPFDDSAKNIVYNQVKFGTRHHYRILSTKQAAIDLPGTDIAGIYGGAGTYSAGVAQNLKVMLYGLRSRGADLYHYFFAPNAVTSTAGRVQRLLARVKTVQTVCSVPKDFANIDTLLFGDRIIVLSAATRRRMVDAGVDDARLVHVRPGIVPLCRKDNAERGAVREAHGVSPKGKMVLFPGDYEFSTAAKTVAKAVPLLSKAHPDLTVVFACRIKRSASIGIRDQIKADIAAKGLAHRVVFLDHVRDMPAFVGAADVVIMPSESLFAKMDVPLVLLEAMSQRVPLVLADVPPLNELLAYGAGFGVPPMDEVALTEAVGRVFESPSQAIQMGAAGEAVVQDVFNAKKMSETVETTYDEVLSQ